MNYVTIDGIVRKLWASDAQAYGDHLQRLDEISRRNRFGGTVADTFIRGHAERAFEPENVLYGFLADGVLRGVAELRPFSPNAPQAEAAFSIERPWQSHGVGTELLERTLLAARNRGIKHLHITCLSENQRMQQLARKFDAELRRDDDDSVIGEVEAPYPTPMSLMREMIADGTGLATTLLDAQQRALKRAEAKENGRVARRRAPARPLEM
jgi:RimJ/RimL family protein N-acetyltransferase